MKLLFYLLSLSLLTISCQTMPVDNNEEEMEPSLITQLTFEKNIFISAKDVSATYSVKNNLLDSIVLQFPSSCQTGFTVSKDGESIINSDSLQVCAAVMTELILHTTETKSYEISLSGFDVELEPGVYQLNAFLLEGYSDTTNAEFEIKAQ